MNNEKKSKLPTKKIVICIILIVLMFVPYAHVTYYGGTQEWRAVTYVVMDWHKDDRYTNKYNLEGTRFYIFPYSFYSRSQLESLAK